MTPELTTVQARAEHLLSLLPVHVRARDDETGGTLRELLTSVAGELALLEADIQELYDSWFIETCPEWVVPYLGDLVGLTDLPPALGTGSGAAVSRRAVVANTVAYRRRKGTAAVLEQVVRDVTGWPCRAVEYFRLLATTTHQNHVHLERPATASLRDADRLDLVPPSVERGALDALAHTAEVRHISSRRGRYGIPDIGVFVFPHQVYAAGSAVARKTADGWTVHPLGWPTPLFAEPTRERAIEHLAQESDLPVPVRPRRLLALLAAARQDPAPLALPLEVTIGAGDPLTPDRVRVCGLEDLLPGSGADPLDGPQVMVDAVNGRLYPYLDGVPDDPDTIHVTHTYGGTADVGAGTYPRSDTHEAVLADDPYAGIASAGGRAITAQAQVLTDGSAVGSVTTVTAALAAAESAWAATADSTAGATYVVSIGDNESYPGDVAVHLPADTRLVLVAASWREQVLDDGEILPAVPGNYSPEGLRPQLAGSLTVTGEPGSSLVVDGVVLEGDLRIQPGSLGSLTVSQCTLAGTLLVAATDELPNRELSISIVRTIVASVNLPDTVGTLHVLDTVVDPSLTASTTASPAVLAAGAHLEVEGCTVRGSVDVRELDASSSVLDGVVRVEQRQTGCVRFSYVGGGSRVPRRFRCVPASEGVASPGPVYVSAEPGSPSYLSLGAGCPVQIAEGGEDGAEMGVHHHLRRPLRLHAAERLIAPYVPVGLEIAMFGS